MDTVMGSGAAVAGPDLLVLSMLFERPMHPTRWLSFAVTRHMDRLVKVRTTTIYNTVARMLDEGLLSVRDVQREGNRPERTVYELTEVGRRVHRRRPRSC